MAHITGTAGNNTLTGTEEYDFIEGFAGDDRIDGGGGNDYLLGGAGNDIVYGGDGNDSIDLSSDSSGEIQNDQVYGEGGDDLIQVYWPVVPDNIVLLDGGAGNDFIQFSTWHANGTVTMVGGDGDDRFVSDGGDSLTLDAGPGADLIKLELTSAASNYALTLGTGVDTVFISVQDVYPEDPAPPVRIADFEAGAGGDRVGLESYLSLLSGWDRDSNPFATGHLVLVQRGGDSVLAVDFDGGGDELHDFIIYEGVSVGALTHHALGYAPDGGMTPGLALVGTGAADFLLGAGGADELSGSDGADELHGGGGDDEIDGGLGNDLLQGGFGDDLVLGGDGNDVIRESDGGSDDLFGGDGDDEIGVFPSDLEPAATLLLDGGAGNDDLRYQTFGNPRRVALDDVTFIGGDGNDDFTSFRARRSTIDAGEGADFLYLGNAHTIYTIALGGGADIISLEGSGLLSRGHFTIADFQTGTGGDRIDLSWNQAGNPFQSHLRLVQRGADAVLQIDPDGAAGGAAGYTDMMVMQNVDAVDFTAFNFSGYDGSFNVTGTGGDDRLQGAWGVNQLRGLGGNDILDGGAGDDMLEGGAGDDVYVIDTRLDSIVEAANGGNDTVRAGLGYTLPDHFENLALTGGGNFNAIGNGVANALTGNNGNNRLDGRAGADTMAGGLGHDTYVVDHAGDTVVENGTGGNDGVESAVTYTLPIHVEKLILTGMLGNTGRGNGGANSITGNAGGNFLNGNGGNDIIDGGGGDDRLIGGRGNDNLKGGTGSDRFEFTHALGSTNVDKILDFSVPNDTIQLMRSVFTKAGANGVLNAAAFHQGTAAADASDRIVYDQATGKIFYDSDGNGAAAAILFATVTPGTALTHADFMIYG